MHENQEEESDTRWSEDEEEGDENRVHEVKGNQGKWRNTRSPIIDDSSEEEEETPEDIPIISALKISKLPELSMSKYLEILTQDEPQLSDEELYNEEEVLEGAEEGGEENEGGQGLEILAMTNALVHKYLLEQGEQAAIISRAFGTQFNPQTLSDSSPNLLEVVAFYQKFALDENKLKLNKSRRIETSGPSPVGVNNPTPASDEPPAVSDEPIPASNEPPSSDEPTLPSEPSTNEVNSGEIQYNPGPSTVKRKSERKMNVRPPKLAKEDMAGSSPIPGKVVKNSGKTGSSSATDFDDLLKQIRLGTFLWAKIWGFPYWPSFVHGPNPGDPFLRGPKGGDAESKEVHVFFFDQGNLHLSSWVKIRNVKIFSEKNPNGVVKVLHRKRLEYSINEAKKARGLELDVLLKEYYVNPNYGKDYAIADAEKLFEVEEILAKRQEPGKEVEYLVKWEGYTEDYNSWEPKSNLGCPDLIEEFEEDYQESEAAKKKDNESSCIPNSNPTQKINTALDNLLTDEVEKEGQGGSNSGGSESSLSNELPNLLESIPNGGSQDSSEKPLVSQPLLKSTPKMMRAINPEADPETLPVMNPVKSLELNEENKLEAPIVKKLTPVMREKLKIKGMAASSSVSLSEMKEEDNKGRSGEDPQDMDQSQL